MVSKGEWCEAAGGDAMVQYVNGESVWSWHTS